MGNFLGRQPLEGPSLVYVLRALQWSAVQSPTWEILKERSLSAMVMHQILKAGKQGWQIHSTHAITPLASTHGEQQQLVRPPDLNQSYSSEPTVL